jgi:hypothetical protein
MEKEILASQALYMVKRCITRTVSSNSHLTQRWKSEPELGVAKVSIGMCSSYMTINFSGHPVSDHFSELDRWLQVDHDTVLPWGSDLPIL